MFTTEQVTLMAPTVRLLLQRALVISGTTAHGSTCPGVSATPQTYTITNSGAFTVEGISAVSGGANAADFVVSSLSSATIVAGGTATYVVTFTPATSGSKTATITALAQRRELLMLPATSPEQVLLLQLLR